MINVEKKSDLLAIGTLINFIICNLFILFTQKWIIFWLIIFVMVEILIIGRKHIKPILIVIKERINRTNKNNTNDDLPKSPPVAPEVSPTETIPILSVALAVPEVPQLETKMVPPIEVVRPFLRPSSMAPPLPLPLTSTLATVPNMGFVCESVESSPILVRPYIASQSRSVSDGTVSDLTNSTSIADATVVKEIVVPAIKKSSGRKERAGIKPRGIRLKSIPPNG